MKERVPPPCEYVAAWWGSSNNAAAAGAPEHSPQLETRQPAPASGPEPKRQPEPEPKRQPEPEPEPQSMPSHSVSAMLETPRQPWCEDSARAAFRRADEDEAGWLAPDCVPAMLEKLGWPVTRAQAAVLLARMEDDREDADYIQVNEFCQLARWASDGVGADATASSPESGTAETQSTRTLVLQAVLGGVMQLPPEFLLKTMSGACRPYQYSAVVELNVDWSEVPLHVDAVAEPSTAGIAQHTTAQLERWVPSTNPASETSGCSKLGEMANFNVHRFTLQPSFAAMLRSLLGELAMRKESQTRGIEVSNTDGGWHSGRDLFRWLKDEQENPDKWVSEPSEPEEAVALLSRVAANVLNAVEQYERGLRHQTGSRSLHDECVGTTIHPTMLRSSDAWLNINRGAAWNRPHTHEGARWSVVYYVADGSNQRQGHGDGSQGTPGSDLLLIPKHSAKATQWQLTAQERDGLRAVPGSACANPNIAASRATPESTETESTTLLGGDVADRGDEALSLAAAGQPGSDGVCEYVAVPPTPGTFVVFPGWLLHAVLPATARDVSGDCDERNDHDRSRKLDGDGAERSQRLPRISVAFNYEPPV